MEETWATAFEKYWKSEGKRLPAQNKPIIKTIFRMGWAAAYSAYNFEKLSDALKKACDALKKVREICVGNHAVEAVVDEVVIDKATKQGEADG